MLAKHIIIFARPAVLICDGQCNKAWGRTRRPSDRQETGPYGGVLMYQSDAEFEVAPIDPGTYEGSDSKPQSPQERLNRWCARECERSVLASGNEEFEIPDWTTRRVV